MYTHRLQLQKPAVVLPLALCIIFYDLQPAKIAPAFLIAVSYTHLDVYKRQIIASSVKVVAQPTDILTVAFLILPLILLMQAVMLPFQLKFGGEKGRLVIIASIGLIIVLGAVINTIAKIVNIEFSVVFSNLQAMSIGSLLFTASAAALLLLLISMKLSISIMKKKEF